MVRMRSRVQIPITAPARFQTDLLQRQIGFLFPGPRTVLEVRDSETLKTHQVKSLIKASRVRHIALAIEAQTN